MDCFFYRILCLGIDKDMFSIPSVQGSSQGEDSNKIHGGVHKTHKPRSLGQTKCKIDDIFLSIVFKISWLCKSPGIFLVTFPNSPLVTFIPMKICLNFLQRNDEKFYITSKKLENSTTTFGKNGTKIHCSLSLSCRIYLTDSMRFFVHWCLSLCCFASCLRAYGNETLPRSCGSIPRVDPYIFVTRTASRSTPRIYAFRLSLSPICVTISRSAHKSRTHKSPRYRSIA